MIFSYDKSQKYQRARTLSKGKPKSIPTRIRVSDVPLLPKAAIFAQERHQGYDTKEIKVISGFRSPHTNSSSKVKPMGDVTREKKTKLENVGLVDARQQAKPLRTGRNKFLRRNQSIRERAAEIALSRTHTGTEDLGGPASP